MKKILTAAAVVLVGILIAAVLIPDSKTAPAFSLPDMNGKTVSNADLQGKVTLINFWFPQACCRNIA